MRSTDWSGKQPKTPRDAEELLLKGALACAKKHGFAKINIKQVAEEVGVTRQTVYRYFSSSEVLADAASHYVVESFVNKLLKHIDQFDDFENKVIEAVLFLIKTIPKDPYLNQYFSPNTNFIQNMSEVFDSTPLDYSYMALKGMYTNKEVTNEEEAWLRLLSEHMLRTVIGLLIAPSKGIKKQDDLRHYLDICLKPLLKIDC